MRHNFLLSSTGESNRLLLAEVEGLLDLRDVDSFQQMSPRYPKHFDMRHRANREECWYTFEFVGEVLIFRNTWLYFRYFPKLSLVILSITKTTDYYVFIIFSYKIKWFFILIYIFYYHLVILTLPIRTSSFVT